MSKALEEVIIIDEHGSLGGLAARHIWVVVLFAYSQRNTRARRHVKENYVHTCWHNLADAVEAKWTRAPAGGRCSSESGTGVVSVTDGRYQRATLVSASFHS